MTSKALNGGHVWTCPPLGVSRLSRQVGRQSADLHKQQTSLFYVRGGMTPMADMSTRVRPSAWGGMTAPRPTPRVDGAHPTTERDR